LPSWSICNTFIRSSVVAIVFSLIVQRVAIAGALRLPDLVRYFPAPVFRKYQLPFDLYNYHTIKLKKVNMQFI
jgi:hypothetical protein